jgi:glutamyl endopeptidase
MNACATSLARLLVSVAAATALIGLGAPATAQVVYLDESVSDDGSSPPSSRDSAASFSPSYSGPTDAAAPRTAADMARYGARPATAEFHERVRRAKPKRPRYAGAEPESVIGPDGRTKVTNTKTFPARATVIILFNGGFLCSGWLVNRNTVVTAGHCVADGDGTPLFDRTTYEIAPGYNESANPKAPYGVCGARRLYTNAGWKNQGRDDFDYGAIKLDCNVGNQTGFYGYSKNVAKDNRVTTQGYPGDKPFGTQWKMAGRVTVLQARRVFYKIDTFGGQSGSPVWRNINANCTHCGIAIHAYGIYGSPPFSTNNHGTRIINTVFQNITNWKNAP